MKKESENSGITWSTVNKFNPEWNYTIPEPQDRIDFLFYRGDEPFDLRYKKTFPCLFQVPLFHIKSSPTVGARSRNVSRSTPTMTIHPIIFPFLPTILSYDSFVFHLFLTCTQKHYFLLFFLPFSIIYSLMPLLVESRELCCVFFGEFAVEFEFEFQILESQFSILNVKVILSLVDSMTTKA